MKHAAWLWPVALVATMEPLSAQEQKPITNRDPDVEDVITSPAQDLNLKNEQIPVELLNAEARPYSLDGLNSCSALSTEINELNAILGADIDLPQEERDKLSEGSLAKSVVNSFIPFRGIIREVSGANEKEKQLLSAIRAGFTRRGFLKGVGAARKCPYPAAPASAKDIAAIKAQQSSGK